MIQFQNITITSCYLTITRLHSSGIMTCSLMLTVTRITYMADINIV